MRSMRGGGHGHQRLHGHAEQLLAPVAEQLLGTGAREDDLTVDADRQQGIGHHLQQLRLPNWRLWLGDGADQLHPVWDSRLRR